MPIIYPQAARDEEDRSNILPSAEFFESPRGKLLRFYRHCKKLLTEYFPRFSEHVEDPKPAPMSGVKIFLVMLFVALAIIACVVMGIMFFQKHQEKSRKRFYWDYANHSNLQRDLYSKNWHNKTLPPPKKKPNTSITVCSYQGLHVLVKLAENHRYAIVVAVVVDVVVKCWCTNERRKKRIERMRQARGT